MVEKPRSTVLAIDDDPAVRQVMANYLTGKGYEVLEAVNGLAGLEVFDQARPDVVLVDLRMPEVDGLDVLANIGQRSPNTPVIVVSGTGIIGDAIEALRLGAWDYVLKPIHDFEVLDLTIRRALERARLRRENEEYHMHLEESLAKIREDEEAGRKIQLRLLPPPESTIGPYTLTRHVLPSAFLSGDFVDYFAIDDDCTGFYTADVSGHGVSSALVTVFLKSFVRKQLDRHWQQEDRTILQPAGLLDRLNAELIKEDLEKHVTIFYAVLRASENAMTFANGGQFPSPILWAGGVVETIEEKGAAVGLFPTARYQEVRRRLPDEFLLAVFSDGVLDALPQQGLDRKLAFLATLGSRDALARLAADLHEKESLPDDITFLTIGREMDDE